MKKESLNQGWQFADTKNETKKTQINLPHDAMLFEKRIPNIVNGAGSAYFPGGQYIYTKELDIAAEAAGNTTVLEFEGIYQKSSVWLNEQKVGGRIYGYSDFLVDLTGKLKEGKNLLRVEVDNTQIPNSRWYTGSGIYRDVWLWTGEKEYIKPYGIRALTKSINPAVLSVSVDAFCGNDAFCRFTVLKDGLTVAQLDNVAAANNQAKTGEQQFHADILISDAKLWSAESPELYKILVELQRGETVLDSASERVGLRTLAWSAKDGFTVNGMEVKLRGGCVHHDHGPLGAKSFKAAELRRARILKDAGFNAVRYAHNPASNAFLDACDEVGLYVMDETFDTWYGPKSEYDYALYFDDEHEQDLRDMIRVAYNHPSVIMYSIGNEIQLKDLKECVPITKEMVDICHEEDPRRPVLNAVNPMAAIMGAKRAEPERKNEIADPCKEGKAKGLLAGSFLFNILVTHFATIVKLVVNEKKLRKVNDVFAPLDIVGFNYGNFLYEAHHSDYPERVLVGSETYPREIYDYWGMVKKHSYIVGDFTWTAWDYLGEAGVGAPSYGEGAAFNRPYPCISAGCSNVDMTGYLKCQGHYFRAVYGLEKAPYLAVHPVNHSGEKLILGSWALTDAVHSWSWNGLEGRKAVVDVYADAYCTELFLNGQSFGRKPLEKCIATFEVPYKSGELKAVSYDEAGNILGEDILETAGDETILKVYADKRSMKADGQDLIYVCIELTDDKGIVKSMGDQKVQVRVTGAAELAGICSGNAFTEYSFVGDRCETYYGRALAVLRSNGEAGEISVSVRTQDRREGKCSLKAEA